MLIPMSALLQTISTAIRTGGRTLWLAAFTVILTVPASVWAQQATPAPQPSLKKFPAPWIGMAFMFLMAAIVVVISLMPSKRSHQD